jgi:hypothetical protein
MKISVTRSGGFAAMRPQTTEVATESLPPADAAKLETLAASLPDHPDAPPAPGGDQYQYDVTVAHAGGSRSYTFHGEQSPAADLIAHLRTVAHSQPNQ